jgi:hypothetical protein
LIKLRIDVDYPYPSRIRSSLYTMFGVKVGGDYLENSKIIAKMINESMKDVMAYWFFTPKTIPDQALLALLPKEKHEVALHIVNDPYKDLALLEKATGRKIKYYTIHGTARLIGRIIWGRWKFKAPTIPAGFPLQSFYQFPTLHLDTLCHVCTTEQAIMIARKHIDDGDLLHIHPIWLFQRGRINYRGPYFDTLRKLLEVENRFDNLAVQKRLFFKIGHDTKEYEKDANPSENFLETMKAKGVDIFTFIERRWCQSGRDEPREWFREKDNVGLLHVTSYAEWQERIGKKTRNMIRKAEKSEIFTRINEPDKKFAEGVWKIYNETPIRQERSFPHFGATLDQVSKILSSADNFTYIGAYLHDELVGFIQLVDGENVEIISQILSLQKYWDKAVNNALIAKVVEVCTKRGAGWIMYGRMGNHPSLDKFKESNGFSRFELTRYYIPLTNRGKIAARLNFHRNVIDNLPKIIKYPLLRLYGWINRARAKTSREAAGAPD